MLTRNQMIKQNKFPGDLSLALLIDPDKVQNNQLKTLLRQATEAKADYIMAGGSLTFNSIEKLIREIKAECTIPVVLFPGNLLQLTCHADKILLLSLISGRNPELLIGNHVLAAPYLKDYREKIISTGYILISCGSKTSVEYISQTEAIPSDKPEIAVATAIAGEMLGMSMIYLEGGSGANKHVPAQLIREVRKNISLPLAVGGGIKNAGQIKKIYRAGANLIILGNGCEKNPQLLKEACEIRNELRKQKKSLPE